MSAQFIKRLDELTALEKRARNESIRDLEKTTRDLASCVLEAQEHLSKSPSSPQNSVLQYRLQRSAEDLLLNANQLLFLDGQLEAVFNIVPDPVLLNGAVHKAFWRDAGKTEYELAREALRLGAVWLTSSNGLVKQVLERDEIAPPVDICRLSLIALVEKQWAFDSNKLSNMYQAQLIFALLAVCSNEGEHDFVIDYLRSNQENFLNDFAVNMVTNYSNLVTHLVSVIKDVKDESLMVRLAETDPDLYTELGRSSYLQSDLLGHVVGEGRSSFDLSNLPASEFLDQEFLSACLAGLLRKDRLTEHNHAMLSRAWEKNGLPGTLEAFSRKNGQVSECLEYLKHYRAALSTEMDCRRLSEIKSKDYAPGKSTLCLDSIYPMRGGKITDDSEKMARHTAVFICTRGDIPDEAKAKGKIDVDELILGACLMRVHEVYKKSEEQNQEVLALITGVFDDKSKHHMLKTITKERLDELRVYCKSITDDHIKTVRWDDYRIHGDVFTQELGV